MPRRPPILGRKTIAFSTNAQSWFASVVLDSVLGPRVSHGTLDGVLVSL